MTNRAGNHWRRVGMAGAVVVLAAAAGCGGGDAGIGQAVSGTDPADRQDRPPASTTPATTATTLGPGGQPDVAQVQTRLNALGCDAGTVDGAIGAGTTAAIQRFQSAAGLTPDGVLGPMTAARLAEAAEAGSPSCRGGEARLTSTPPTTAGSTPDCSEAALRTTAQRYLGDNAFESMTGSECSGDWAYAFARLKSQAETPGTFEATLLMRWDGVANRWNVVDRSSACRDRKVPEDIREPACTTN